MMTEPQEAVYIPKHMAQTVIDIDLGKLRQLAEQLPDGIILSVDLEEVITDEQEDG